MSEKHWKHGIIDHGKYKKHQKKRTDRYYHVQDNTNVSHTDVKMYFNTNQFSELSFCGPHMKPRGARGLSKYYRLCFDPKIGNGICANFRILCTCVACTSMLDKPCIFGIPSKKQSQYQPIIDFT